MQWVEKIFFIFFCVLPCFSEANTLVEVPAEALHQITLLGDENKLVIIPPDRSD
jgi:hypothetical protein